MCDIKKWNLLLKHNNVTLVQISTYHTQILFDENATVRLFPASNR